MSILSVIYLLIVVQLMNQENHLDWDWRQQFSRFTSDIAKCIEVQLHHACNTCITSLSPSKMEPIQMLEVDAPLIGGRLDYPQKTATVKMVM